jgi:hypothetical protein
MPRTISKEVLNPASPSGAGPVIESPALVWLWKYFGDVPHPFILDCGRVKPQSVDVLLRRGSKIFVADIVSIVQRPHPMLWDRRPKVPVFLVHDFLVEMPKIPSGSLNAIFCWHLLDLLPRESLQKITDLLFSCLQPGGVLFFLLREPHLPKGADSIWWLQSLTALAVSGEGNKPFPYSVISGRDVERFLPTGSLKSFLTRSGRREVLVLK